MPRRPRLRRLKTPLGLLALLLLPLLLLQRLRPVLFPVKHRVIQISMPIPRAKAAALMAEAAKDRTAIYVPIHTFTLPADLDRLLPWHSYSLIGSAQHDAAMLRAAEAFIIDQGTCAGHGPGVRIAFGPGTRYSQLVAALDLMRRVNAKKYALDLERPEPVLYVFGRRDPW